MLFIEYEEETIFIAWPHRCRAAPHILLLLFILRTAQIQGNNAHFIS